MGVRRAATMATLRGMQATTAGIPQAAQAFGISVYLCEPQQPCTCPKIAFFKIFYTVASAQNDRINEKGTANDIIAAEL
jgi:hypothetical protein